MENKKKNKISMEKIQKMTHHKKQKKNKMDHQHDKNQKNVPLNHGRIQTIVSIFKCCE